MTISMIFFGIAFVFMIMFLFMCDENNKNDFTLGFVFGLFMTTLISGLIILTYNKIKEPKPNAIDVYRNKTELEITSVNGVPQDTVVVWKEGKQ